MQRWRLPSRETQVLTRVRIVLWIRGLAANGCWVPARALQESGLETAKAQVRAAGCQWGLGWQKLTEAPLHPAVRMLAQPRGTTGPSRRGSLQG